MADGFLTGTVGFLALLGVVALGLRLAGSVGRVLLGSAEAAAARSMAETSARRGDLTALSEARSVVERGKARRRRALLTAAGWAVWITLPLAIGGVREAWALAAPLWLLSRPKASSGPTARRSIEE